MLILCLSVWSGDLRLSAFDHGSDVSDFGT
jgi:hypothetical protein